MLVVNKLLLLAMGWFWLRCCIMCLLVLACCAVGLFGFLCYVGCLLVCWFSGLAVASGL